VVPIRPTIAVLPLSDLSDESQDYFSDGMTEEILTQLGRLHPRLGVIARTSVMKYKDTRKSMRQIGRELGVEYALEGSVRRHAGRVRVTVQLIETRKQTHLWAESYEHPLDDVLKLQDRLAREIAGRIGSQPRQTRRRQSRPRRA
jgi:TolB-like protein